MDIITATKSYGKWLARYTPLVQADLDHKYEAMATAAFPFMRATFYRWLQLWPKVCETEVKAPRLLGVGDLHVENFGTWRDAEGRLIWGVNDFDECAWFAYTNDLVRLAASALLASRESRLKVTPQAACEAIAEGYRVGIASAGEPFVLAERHAGLRAMASGALREPTAFWARMEKLPEIDGPVPESAVVALEHLLPDRADYVLRRRVAGLGSLGHPRFVAMAECAGGKIAREAKALVPSSAAWAKDLDGVPDIFYQAVLDRSIRCRDPFVRLEGHWIVRRLAPDCSRIDLASLPQEGDEAQLLNAMGVETANIHLGSKAVVADVRKDYAARKAGWLLTAANAMANRLEEEQREWAKNRKHK